MCKLYSNCLIMNIYLNECLQIKWNSFISEKYSFTNGVKQGGMLSPILFVIYMDSFIKRLKGSNIMPYVSYVIIM